MEPLEPCLRAIVYSVQHHLYSQSVFFADRMLNTSANNSVALELWADALIRAGEYEQVRWQLRGKTLSSRLQYLLAVACVKLEQYQEAQVALLGGEEMVELWSTQGHLDGLDVVEGAAGLYQLGQVAEGLRKREQAYECYAKCLKLCPFMWCAFERLSWLSVCLRKTQGNPREFVAAVFEHDTLMKNEILHPRDRSERSEVSVKEKCTFRTPRKRRRSGSLQSVHSAKSLSPFGQNGAFSPRLPLLDKNPVTPTVTPVRPWSPGLVRRVFSPQETKASPKSPKSPRKFTRSSFTSDAYRLQNNALPERLGRSEIDGCDGFSGLLQGLGEALHLLHRFRCQEAINAVKTLHVNEQHSAFCADLVARCHFEMQNYEEASQKYAQCCIHHRFFPSLGLEYYSTALWQLGNQLELGNLSRQVLDWGRNARNRPRAWCVLGNCFSLNNEAETRERRIALSRHFSVLKTSLGAVLQELGDAREALQLLSSAGAGSGSSLLSLQARHTEAVEELQRACYLAPKEPGIHFHLGQSLRTLGDNVTALKHFTCALDLANSAQDRHLADATRQELRQLQS
eukprot:Skav231329  [mRNA]  locus=scaffold819:76846:79579:- [translate_table: standard]